MDMFPASQSPPQWTRLWVRLGGHTEQMNLGAQWLGRSASLVQAVVAALYDKDSRIPVGLDVVQAHLSLDRVHALSKRQDLSVDAFAQLFSYLDRLPSFQDSAMHQSPATEEVHLYLEVIATGHIKRVKELHHLWMRHRPSNPPYHALHDEIVIPVQLYYVWQLCHQVIIHHSSPSRISLQSLLEHVYVSSEIELEPCDIRHMLMVLSHASPAIFWSQPPRLQSEGLEDVEATHAMIQRVLLEEELGGSGAQSGGKRM